MTTVKLNRTDQHWATAEGYDQHRDDNCGAFPYLFPEGAESVVVAVTVAAEPDLDGDYLVEFPDGSEWFVTGDNLRAAGVEL